MVYLVWPGLSYLFCRSVILESSTCVHFIATHSQLPMLWQGTSTFFLWLSQSWTWKSYLARCYESSFFTEGRAELCSMLQLWSDLWLSLEHLPRLTQSYASHCLHLPSASQKADLSIKWKYMYMWEDLVSVFGNEITKKLESLFLKKTY